MLLPWHVFLSRHVNISVPINAPIASPFQGLLPLLVLVEAKEAWSEGSEVLGNVVGVVCNSDAQVQGVNTNNSTMLKSNMCPLRKRVRKIRVRPTKKAFCQRTGCACGCVTNVRTVLCLSCVAPLWSPPSIRETNFMFVNYFAILRQRLKSTKWALFTLQTTSAMTCTSTQPRKPLHYLSHLCGVLSAMFNSWVWSTS